MSSPFFHRTYYAAKPLMPWRLRNAVRGAIVRRQRAGLSGVWPMLPGSEKRPAKWPGWPHQKQFAFVLTHDVEGHRGLENCRALMELEMSLGFRSCFNFVPEGNYRVTPEFRNELIRNGFEVGVHDLRHDGSLYRNRSTFAKQALQINEYIREWGASGFRAGFMFHNLEWLHDLRSDYDASTFDTDPFEPQNDGAGTIFPFWVARHNHEQRSKDDERTSDLSRGYAELPYTLPQDSTVFLLLRERSTALWEAKLDWIARHGGLALLITHPDYMAFEGLTRRHDTFPVELYAEFLRFVKARYESQMWQALPKDVGAFVHNHKEVMTLSVPHLATSPPPLASSVCVRKGTIWIDLENTPHIPFFKPIIRELRRRGYSVVVSARDAYQTCEMAERFGLEFTRIGHHYGRKRTRKAYGLLARSAQLMPFALKHRPVVALNHGSRTQNLICNLMRTPTVTIMDYEYSSSMALVNPRWWIVPRVVNMERNHCRGSKGILKYDGIKEDVYVPGFQPDPAFLREIGLNGNELLVTVRPPATEAHYHNPESDVLFEQVLRHICSTPGIRAVVLPRNKNQEKEIRSRWPQWFEDGRIIIPDKVVDGLNLLWYSDLAVSGGGTMNREAAALGVPVYSIFRGRIGAVDEQLRAEGRLVLITTVEEVHEKILLQPRSKSIQKEAAAPGVLAQVIEHIERIIKAESVH